MPWMNAFLDIEKTIYLWFRYRYYSAKKQVISIFSSGAAYSWNQLKIIIFFRKTQKKSFTVLCRNGMMVVRRTVGQIPRCKETSNLMWLSFIWFILVLFVCWNIFWTIANLRIKCVTETKKFLFVLQKS